MACLSLRMLGLSSDAQSLIFVRSRPSVNLFPFLIMAYDEETIKNKQNELTRGYLVDDVVVYDYIGRGHDFSLVVRLLLQSDRGAATSTAQKLEET